ncbi:MAG: hypothetical protein AMS15_00800 [Planctomycetes bacterium DG_23]|nr:MAG: hypothetical protein AMS15_00800 [Planctomycetes bacterium DG_23]
MTRAFFLEILFKTNPHTTHPPGCPAYLIYYYKTSPTAVKVSWPEGAEESLCLGGTKQSGFAKRIRSSSGFLR